MHGLPLLHAGLPVPGTYLRVERPTAQDAQVQHVLRAAERGETDGLRRDLSHGRHQERQPRRVDCGSAKAPGGQPRPVLPEDLRPERSRRLIGAVSLGRAVRPNRPAHGRAPRAASGHHLAGSRTIAGRGFHGSGSVGRHLLDHQPARRGGQSGGPAEMTRKFPKITFWRAVFAAILLSGIYATYLRVRYGLGGATNLSDKFPWGIWIGFDVM